MFAVILSMSPRYGPDVFDSRPSIAVGSSMSMPMQRWYRKSFEDKVFSVTFLFLQDSEESKIATLLPGWHGGTVMACSSILLLVYQRKIREH